MRRRIIRVLLLGALPLISAIIAVWLLSTPRASLSPPLPNPNGYDDYVAAGEALTVSERELVKMTNSELREVVHANSNSLHLARVAGHEQTSARIDVSTNYFPTYAGQMAAVFTLAEMLQSEGRIAELDRRYADAASSYSEIVRIGIQVPKGGTDLHLIRGSSFESWGVSLLRNLATNLDAANCRRTAQELQQLDVRRESWTVALKLGHQVEAQLPLGIRERLIELFEYPQMLTTLKHLEAHYYLNVLTTRRLIADLAARAYILDHGKPPISITNLVPEYIEAVPVNPTNGAPIVPDNPPFPNRDGN